MTAFLPQMLILAYFNLIIGIFIAFYNLFISLFISRQVLF